MDRKKHSILRYVIFTIFFITYFIYFKFYNNNSVENTIESIYTLIVGGGIGVSFVIPIYMYGLIGKTKKFFNIHTFIRFKSYDAWWRTLLIRTFFHSIEFIVLLNTVYILAAQIGSRYNIDCDLIKEMFKLSIMQILILTFIGLIIQFCGFLWEKKYISFLIVYCPILLQYGVVRLFRLPNTFTIVDMIFCNPSLLSTEYLFKYLLTYTSLIVCIYFVVNLIIAKKDILWGNVNEKN